MPQTGSPIGNPEQPSAQEVRWELDHVLASQHLQASENRRAFLRYIVEETLAGRSDKLKGYNIAIAVFERDETFDAQSDPVVRVEARRLRRDLDSYYMNTSVSDSVRISIPKGGYVPHFTKNTGNTTTAGMGNEKGGLPDHSVDSQPSDSRVSVNLLSRLFSGKWIFAGSIAMILVISIAVWSLNSRSTPAGSDTVFDEPAVVVLPFTALGSTDLSRYLAVGISQELINDLIRFPGFRLYSSSIGVQPERGASSIGGPTARNVGFIVSGSVRDDGEEAHVLAQLNHAATGEVLWSQSFNRPLTPHSMIQLQKELAAAIATQVGQPYGYIQTVLRSQSTTPAVANMQSYICVLRAYQYRRAFEQDQFEPILRCLESAVQNDPEYSDAWAMLGWLHLDAGRFDFYGENRMNEEYENAFQAASRAVQQEPDNILALKALSSINHYMGRFKQAEQLARRAVELNPNDPDALAQLGWRLAARGNFDEGISVLQRAIERTVNPPGWYFHLIAVNLYLAGEYEQMLSVAQRSAVDGSELSYVWLAIANGALDDREGAKQALEKMSISDSMVSDPVEYFRRHGATDRIVDSLMAGLAQAERVAYGGSD